VASLSVRRRAISRLHIEVDRIDQIRGAGRRTDRGLGDQPAAPATAAPGATWIRAELVDRHGRGSASATELRRDSLTTRRTGAFATTPLDLRTLLARGARLTVGVHHASGGPTITQDLIEYALMADFVP
jgi:hypothetical protein